MSDFVLRTGDQAIFLPPFGPAIVVPVAPGILQGTAQPYSALKMAACVEGDEKQVQVPEAYPIVKTKMRLN